MAKTVRSFYHTGDNLFGGLGLIQRPLLAHHLLFGKPARDWSSWPGEFKALVMPSTANSSKALLLRLTLAKERTYCLIVWDGKVTVLHGMVEPP